MSAATDTTPRTTDGTVAADLFSSDLGAAGEGTTATPQAEDSSSLGLEWLRLLLATLARTGLILAVSMAAWASVPALWGWEPTTVMSGSMEPAISTGDVVVVRPMDPSEYKPNRVVLVDNPDNPEMLRLHRIVESNESGQLVLRGDANNDNDATPVAPAAVHGVGFLNIPYVGLPVYWIQTAQWLKVIAVVVGFIFMCWASTLDRDLHRSKHRANPPTRGTGDSTPQPGNGGLEALGLGGEKSSNATMARSKYGVTGRRSARIGTAVLASALVLGTVPVASQAAFTATARNTSNVFTGALSCGATMLADSPTSLYQFNNDSGSAVVDSVAPGAGNGTFQGARNFSATPCAGDGGRSATFNGANYITTPARNVAAPNTFSYEMWFRTNTRGSKLMSFTSGTGDPVTLSDSRVLYITDKGFIRFGINHGTGEYLTSKYVADGEWHHVAVAMSPTASTELVPGPAVLIEIYVDNSRTNYSTIPAPTSIPVGGWTIGTGSKDLTWTRDRIGLSPYFVGDIDNVAIYNGRFLTTAQVSTHFLANRAAMNRSQG